MMSTRNSERTGGLGRPQYAERLAEYRRTSSSGVTMHGHSGALTDPLRREGPAEREGDLYDVNGNRGYLGLYRGPGNLLGARSWLDY